MKDPQERVSFFERIEKRFAWASPSDDATRWGKCQILVDARYGIGMGGVHPDAVCCGTAVSPSLVSYQGDGNAREYISPD